MAVSDSERRDIIVKDREFRKELANEWREQNDAIVRRYNDELGKCGTEEGAIKVVCDVFGVGVRRVKNAIMRQLGSNNPALQAMTGAVILGHMGKLIRHVEEAQGNLHYELEKLDELEDSGISWVEVEETDDNNERSGFSCKTKKVSVAEERKRLLSQNVELSQVFFNSIKALLPQSVINTTIDNRRFGDELGVIDLEKEIKQARGEIFEK